MISLGAMGMTKQSKPVLMTLLSLGLLAGCSQGKFSAAVNTAKTAAPDTEKSEDSIGTKDDDRLVPSPVGVPEATPIFTPKPDKETPDLGSAPIVISRPPDGEIFSECGKYANTNIVADLYPTSEARFYEVGQKPLAALNYTNPNKTFCMSNLNIPMRNFTEGFPGFPDLKAWFILDIHFLLDAPEAGNYTFLLDSDDGSIVTINGETLINVDGLRNGNLKIFERREKELNKTGNVVRVQYMQGPGFDLALQLKWIRPGESEAEFIPIEYIRKRER